MIGQNYSAGNSRQCTFLRPFATEPQKATPGLSGGGKAKADAHVDEVSSLSKLNPFIRRCLEQRN